MMDIDIAKVLAFKSLGIDMSKNSAKRISQKKIYLTQFLGINLGFRFIWSCYGPYSSDLVKYIEDNNYNKPDVDGMNPKDTAKDIFNKVNDIVNDRPYHLTVPLWYELLGSIVFAQESIGQEYLTFIKFQEFSEKFSRLMFDYAYSLLIKRGFINNKNKGENDNEK